MTDDTLLPCPFCGDDGDKGRQQVTMMDAKRTVFTRVLCRCCGAMAPELNWQSRAAREPVAQADQRDAALSRGDGNG